MREVGTASGEVLIRGVSLDMVLYERLHPSLIVDSQDVLEEIETSEPEPEFEDTDDEEMEAPPRNQKKFVETKVVVETSENGQSGLSKKAMEEREKRLVRLP